MVKHYLSKHHNQQSLLTLKKLSTHSPPSIYLPRAVLKCQGSFYKKRKRNSTLVASTNVKRNFPPTLHLHSPSKGRSEVSRKFLYNKI